jgi:hypothetical protein
MADHPDVPFGESELAGDLGGGAAVVERHDEDGTLPFREPLEAAEEILTPVAHGAKNPCSTSRNGRIRGARYGEIGSEGLEELLASRHGPAEIQHGQAADPEHERNKTIGLPESSRAQPLDGQDEYLLDQIFRRVGIAQVLASVEAHTRNETPAELLLRAPVDPRGRISDAPCQIGIVRRREGKALLHERIIAHPPFSQEVGRGPPSLQVDKGM